MIAFTIYSMLLGGVAPVIGRMIGRYDVRKIIAGGGLMAGLGFASLSLMSDLRVFYGGYAVIGVGMAALGSVPATVVVSNWFQKRRGTAIGIMSTGMGAGGFILAPLFGGYLIPVFGWRVSYLALAVLTWLLVIPFAWLVLKEKPADMGLYPDGAAKPEPLAEGTAPASTSEGMTLRRALATAAFWLISGSFLASGFSLVGILLAQVPYLEDIGFPVAIASSVLGAIGLISLAGRIGFGWLCDRIPAKYVGFIGSGFQVVSLIVLMNVQPESSPVMLWLYVLTMGVSVGSWLPVLSMLVSTTFGLASYGTIFGIALLTQSIGVAVGPIVAGYMYDSMNTYQGAFIIFLIVYGVSMLTILAVRRPESL